MSLSGLLVGILTVALVLICVFLILLVLVQLPKKDAGVGMAFGGGAADALFGAGSGNALTKVTKWTAVGFLALSLVLGLLESKLHPTSSATDFSKMVDQRLQQSTATSPVQQPKSPAAPAAGNNLLQSMVPTGTNTPAPAPMPTATNSAK